MKENVGVALGATVLDNLYTCPTCGLVLMDAANDCDSCCGGVL